MGCKSRPRFPTGPDTGWQVNRMYRVTAVDPRAVLPAELKDLRLWTAREDFALTEPVREEAGALAALERAGTDIAFLAANGRSVDEIELIDRIRQSRLELRFVLVGGDDSYEYVRQAFRSGALDYLVRPLTEQAVDQAIGRIYETSVARETYFHVTTKVEQLIGNLFSEDGRSVPLICGSLIDTIYGDFQGDPLNAQMAAERTKDRIYRELIRRKPWLEKFLIADKYIYRTGFQMQSRAAIQHQWIRDFTRVGSVIHKYHMIDYKLVYPIGKYIVVHVDEKLSLEKIARDVFLSKNYISNIFKKYVGMSVVDFIREVKVDRAKVLLTEENRKIREIAEKLNFTDTEYFTKIFKEKTGFTPSEYRKQ